MLDSKKYTISIDHDLKIIKYKHSGILKPDDIGHVWANEFLKMKEFTELKYNLLSDYSEAKFDAKTSIIPELIEFMKAIKEIVKGKKQSIIIEDHFSTAASLIFENEINAKVGFEVKIFRTQKAALKWVSH